MAFSEQQRRELQRLTAVLRESDLDEGIWDTEQAARLEELLAASPQARQEYLRLMELHAELHWRFAHAEEDNRAIAGDAPATTPASHSIWPQRLRSFFAQPTPLSMSVAALVVGLVVTGMAFTAAPFYRALTRSDAPSAGPVLEMDAVAQITGLHKAVWADGVPSSSAGAYLPSGKNLQLDSGLVEVTFNNGAVAVLEGPALFTIDSRQGGTLERGKLAAHAPPSAIGFEVATPSVKIIDLGTEFAVAVAKDKSGEVHVLTGQVEVVDPRDASAKKIVLSAGQAWKFQSNGASGTSIDSQPQLFALSLPKPQVAIFQDGRPDPITGQPYQGTEETMLIEWARDKNFGARPDFDVGQLKTQRAHTLVRFDLSSLRGEVDRILSVTLRITPNSDVSYFPWGNPGEIELYRVSDANIAWQEGVHAGGDNPKASDGESTWDRLSHPAQRWAGTHGASTAGADHETPPLAAALYATRTDFPLEFHLRGKLDFINDWINGQQHAGFLLKDTLGTADNRINFHSSESDDVSARPQLVVRYLAKDAASAEPLESNKTR